METIVRSRIPIWEVARDHIVSITGVLSVGFRLTRPEIYTLSAADLAAIHQCLVKAMGCFQLEALLVFQDWFFQNTWKGNPTAAPDEFLAQASERYHHERPVLDHESYLFVSLLPRRMGRSAAVLLRQPGLFPPETTDERTRLDFNAQTEVFIRVLEDSGFFTCTRLCTEELTGTENRPGLIERYCQLLGPDDPPMLQDIDLDGKIRVGEKHVVLHSLSDADRLPAQCSAAVAYGPYSTERSPFPVSYAAGVSVQLRCNHIYTQYITLRHAHATRKRLEQKAGRLRAFSMQSRENAATAAAIGAFLEEAYAGQKLLVGAHYNLLCWGDQASIADISREAGAAIVRMGATDHIETLGAGQLFIAGIPGNGADLPAYELADMTAEEAACFLAIESNYRDSASPFGMRLGDRIHGRPVWVDLSDEPMRKGWISNRNKLICGSSGSGKSYLVNNLLYWYLLQGAHMVVVDIGNSYSGLCQLWKGVYYRYAGDQRPRFNPFWLPDGEAPDTEKLEAIKMLILVLWKKDDEPHSRSEYVALSNGLQQYFEKVAADPGLFPCFDSFYAFLRDEYAKTLAREKVRPRDFDLDNFLYVLRPFYGQGEFGYLLNSRERLDLLQEQMVVFELDEIKDHPILFPVVTLIIMEVFISKMRRLQGIRKVFVMDEAWKPLMRPVSSEMVKYLFKTMRKYFGEGIVATQELDDLVSNPIVKQAIINNADVRLLLDHGKFSHKFDEIQQALALTDKQKAQVLSINKDNDPTCRYKELYVGLGVGPSKVYRVEGSLEEYLCYTTEEREKLKVQEWARRHGGLRAGIAALARAIRNGSVKLGFIGLLLLAGLLWPRNSQAQIPILDIIQEAVKRVIVATDLEVQRLQTATAGLEQTEQELETSMRASQLGAITDWVSQEKDLFSGYYQELWRVKDAIVFYQRVKDLTTREAQLVRGCQQARSLLSSDPHFSAAELQQMGTVYDGILQRSGKNVAVLAALIKDFILQMEDGDRLSLVDGLDKNVDDDYRDLQQYTQENILLSLQRSQSEADLQTIRQLYHLD